MKLGVIGHGGRISGVIKNNLCKMCPDLRVTAVVDPDEEAARSRLPERDHKDARFYKTVDAMVRAEKLDCLAIGTRCNLHSDYAVQAAKYDLPLYLEKPVSISMAQANKLEKAFKKTRCQVVVSFPLRVSPLCELAKTKIRDGSTGKPEHITALNYVPYGTVYWESFYRDYAISGGLFLQKATHDIDYISYLMGSPIVRVSAMANFGHVFGGKKPDGLSCSKCKEQDFCLEGPRSRQRSGNHSQGDHHCVFSSDCGNTKTGTNEDCSSCLMEFASGAHGLYTQVFFSRRDAAMRGATVSGYHGTLSFDWYTNNLKLVNHHAPFSSNTKATEGMSHFGGDDELARDFISLVQGKIKYSRTPIETGLASVYSCLACRDSVKTGKFVKVRQVEM